MHLQNIQYFANFLLACHPNCYQCNLNPNNCTQCKIINSINRELENHCQCKEQYFEQDMSCIMCSYYCQTCYKLNSCLSCSKEMNRQLVDDQCNCQEGYYETFQQANCQKCKLDCLICTSYFECLSCDESRRKIQNQNNTDCICKEGYFLNSTNQCEICHPYCKACSDEATKCTACNDRRVLVGTSCNCFSQEYYDIQLQKCRSCHYFCQFCFGVLANECYACLQNKSLKINNSQCYCEEGLRDVNQTCIQSQLLNDNDKKQEFLYSNIMSNLTKKEVQLIELLEKIVNATNNEEIVNFFKLTSITQLISNPQAIAQLRFLNTLPPIQEYFLICLISRFTITIYCPKWVNINSSIFNHEYIIFGANVTENVFLTISQHQIFNNARVPNNFLVYSQNQMLIVFILYLLIILIYIFSQAYKIPFFHKAIIKHDKNSLLEVTEKYIEQTKRKDYYLYCIVQNASYNYIELQFAQIFVCLFLQMINPTIEPKTSIGMASYIIIYIYLILYFTSLIMLFLKLYDQYFILKALDYQQNLENQKDLSKTIINRKIQILYLSFSLHRGVIKKTRMTFYFSLFYYFASLLKKILYALIISMAYGKVYLQLILLISVEIFNIAIIIILRPHQIIVNIIQVILSLLLIACYTIKIQEDRLRQEFYNDEIYKKVDIIQFNNLGWITTSLYITYCFILLNQFIFKVIKEIKRYKWYKVNLVDEENEKKTRQLRRQVNRHSVRILNKMKKKEDEFEEYLREQQSKNKNMIYTIPEIQITDEKQNPVNEEVKIEQIEEVNNPTELDNYLNQYEEYLRSFESIYADNNSPEKKNTNQNELIEQLKSLYPEGTKFYPQSIDEIQLKSMPNFQKIQKGNQSMFKNQ